MTVVEENQVNIYDSAIYYLACGDGPVILSIHGSGRPASLRAPVRRRNLIMLATHGFKVISPDLPGFGKSPLPDSLSSVFDYPLYLAEFLKEIRISKANIMGLSMGGLVSTLFAVEKPSLVDKMVLIASAGLYLENAPIRWSTDENPESLTRRLFFNKNVAEMYIQSGAIDNTEEENREFLRTMRRVYPKGPVAITEQISKVNVPTLIVWGRQDDIIPLEYARAFNQLIQGSKLELIDESGHIPQIEKPQEVYKLIHDFLRSQPHNQS